MLTELLQLQCPLVSLDCEMTGIHPQVDRIVQIGLIKMYPDGKITEWSTLVNPQMAIPSEATAVHHITDEMVKDAPTFKAIAPILLKGLEACDLLGYNLSFDIRFIQAEFVRQNITFVPGKIIDGFKIYQRMYPRNLEAAVQEYLQEKMEGAHDALTDARNTMQVVVAQLQRHTELPRSVDGLHKMFFETVAAGHIDPEGKLAWRNGEACLNFGKFAGRSLKQLIQSEPGYVQWMIRGEFSPALKTILSKALAGEFPVPSTSASQGA